MGIKPFIVAIEKDKVSRIILKNLFVNKMGLSQTEIWADSVDFEQKIDSLKEVPQLILLDINIKPLNGYQILKLLRSKTPFVDTKLVVCTASIMPEQVNQFKQAGFNGLISKPIIRSSFPVMIDALLDGQALWYIS